MATLVLSFIFLALVISAMAVGVILSNKPIKGSCGGIQSLGMGGECDICGGDPLQCDKETKAQTSDNSNSSESRFYDAS